MVRKFLIMLLIVMILPAVMAQSIKIEFSSPEKIYAVGDNINLKVSIFDASNKLVSDQVNLVIEDPIKITKIEQTIQSGRFVDISLGENPLNGNWKVTADYNGIKTTENFIIDINEKARFELKDDVLTVTNIGNIQYTKTVKIIIGDRVGIKKPVLNIGEGVSYRLLAPDGVYDVVVSDDGVSNPLSKSGVALTGEVIGILDQSLGGSDALTGTLGPNENNYTLFKRNKFVYVFMLVIVGATILIAVERYYRKKAR